MTFSDIGELKTGATSTVTTRDSSAGASFFFSEQAERKTSHKKAERFWLILLIYPLRPIIDSYSTAGCRSCATEGTGHSFFSSLLKILASSIGRLGR